MQRGKSSTVWFTAFTLTMFAASCATEDTDADSPSSTSVGVVEQLTATDLLSAPVPALCAHEPGVLANGVLPLQDPRYGFVSIYAKGGGNAVDNFMIALGDVTGDGVGDGALVTSCSAGGVSWPATVQVYSSELERLGGVDLGDLTGGREIATAVTIEDGVVRVHWMTDGPADAACCPSVPVSADLRWTGTELVVENLVTG
ncbi:hypothetical protein LQ424_30915 [Rhodococcus qingshengii]|uniref:hypothetical protein n=1 Tax=Rhodococcus qingshengii TaxID=334542 RepID=UPI000E5317EB|nr:hypothetical protein [Rhodococcus qingshengii]MCD2136239.1 hypothetical protein [Rhodococcus qingshengii]RGP45337.1 hypothetical protein AWH04_28410 [Rhodococcus erythropolis]